MLRTLLLVALLGYLSATPVNVGLEKIKESLLLAKENERIGLVEEVILQIMEVLRDIMVNGTEGIPPLDPLFIDRIHVDEEVLNIPGAYVTINNLTVRDVSTFKLESIQLSMASLLLQRYKLDFDLVIPSVNVDTSSYDLSLSVFGGRVFGKGDMNLKVVNPRVKGYFVIGFRITLDGIYLVIHEVKIQIGLDAFEPVITGMFDSEASSEFVSRFLRTLIPEMLDFFEEDITNTVSTIVLLLSNLLLADFDLGSLIPSDFLQNIQN